jgi:D-3-phosphoglycerate dehydrogenase / 2-oxoglutarate reductase
LAFTLVDVDSAVSDAVIQQLVNVAGVLTVRYLPAE